jgi:hypothetical protein
MPATSIAADGEASASPSLREIDTKGVSAMPAETVFANIRKTMALNYPSLDRYPEFQKYKGHFPLAIVAGGPSLNETLDELRQMPVIMVCGSAHDHLVSLGIIPRYCVVCDPDPITADYLTKPHPLCTYFVASQCDEAVFRRLIGCTVVVWHAAGVGTDDEERALFHGEGAVNGGSTVTLRAMVLALNLGYSNQHYFGVDSCYIGENHHSYATDDEAMKAPSNSLVADIRVAGSNRVFYASPVMAAQACQFRDFLKYNGRFVTPTVHGNGLIAEIMKVGERQALDLIEQQSNAAALEVA